jgi:hypothetical protein
MIESSSLLQTVPTGLREPLIQEFSGLCRAFNESRWKLTALDAGRFCEVVYCIVDGALSGSFQSTPKKPGDFVAACRALENRPPVPVGDRSLRILIPRLLPSLYEIRNNRDVGHVGGDVQSNKMDAAFVRDACAWITAELIRVFHNTSTEVAQQSVDLLAERVHPLVWEFEGVKRVLDTTLKAWERALVLLYATPGTTTVKQLNAWVVYPSKFRRGVLEPLFQKRLIELTGDKAIITPLGCAYVEKNLLRSLGAP